MKEVLTWLGELSPLEILLISVGAAFVLLFLLSRVFLRLARRTRTDLDERVLLTLRWPIFLTLIFVGVGFALRRIEPPLAPGLVSFSDSLWVTLGAIVWTRAGMRIGDLVLDALARRAGRHKWIEARSLPLFGILHRILFWGGAVYVILLAWHVDITAWLASAGIIGIAVGFAAKDTLANLFAGIFILADAPYKIGDFIILESGERGRVADIGIRSTRLTTRDDIEITIPNAVIANSKIVNETGGPHEKERVRLTIGVAYGSDVGQVRAVLEDAAASSALIAKEPAPRVRLREFGDSSLVFQLLAWIDEPVLRGRALDQLNTAVYERFLAERIEIPFPQRVVTLKRGGRPSGPGRGEGAD